jgi:hypothetical protein
MNSTFKERHGVCPNGTGVWQPTENVAKFNAVFSRCMSNNQYPSYRLSSVARLGHFFPYIFFQLINFSGHL